MGFIDQNKDNSFLELENNLIWMEKSMELFIAQLTGLEFVADVNVCQNDAERGGSIIG